MTNEEIKQAVDEYFKEMLKLDKDYVDHVTDSWIDDAEDWFVTYWYEKHDDVTLEEGCEFRQYARKRFVELYDEKYGERDAKYSLHCIKNDVKTLLEKYNSVKHHFKTFNAYTEAVTYQFEELVKYLQLLDDIEEGKIESLKQ